MAIGKRKRFAVFERDRFTCGYCGRRPPDVVLEVDHMLPVCEGGGDEQENLITACFDCNRGKSGKVLTVRPEADRESVEMRSERIEQMRAMASLAEQERMLVEELNYRLACYWFEIRGDNDHVLGPEKRSNLRTFQRLMQSEDIFKAMDIAHSRKQNYDACSTASWKYFCGVCWNMIRGNGEPQ